MFQSSLGYQVDYRRNGNNLRGNSNERRIPGVYWIEFHILLNSPASNFFLELTG